MLVKHVLQDDVNYISPHKKLCFNFFWSCNCITIQDKIRELDRSVTPVNHSFYSVFAVVAKGRQDCSSRTTTRTITSDITHFGFLAHEQARKPFGWCSSVFLCLSFLMVQRKGFWDDVGHSSIWDNYFERVFGVWKSSNKERERAANILTDSNMQVAATE